MRGVAEAVTTRSSRPTRRLFARLAPAILMLTGLAIVGSPTSSMALGRPALPAVAGSGKPLAVAAADALAALWTNDASYDDKLRIVLPLVAKAGKVPESNLAAVWARTSRTRMLVLLSALTQVGVPYRARRASAGVGFDCSGLTSWAWSQVGTYLPHQSGRQIRLLRRSSKAEVLPADILYYPGHAMLAIGIGAVMVHAPYRGRTVEVSPPTGRWERNVRVGTPDGTKAPLPTTTTTTTLHTAPG